MLRYLTAAILLLQVCVLNAQSTTDTTNSLNPTSHPVVFSGDTLLYVYGSLGPFSQKERANAIKQRLKEASSLALNHVDSAYVVPNPFSADIYLNEMLLMSVLDEDAEPLGKSREEVAGEYAIILEKAVNDRYSFHSIQELLINIGLMLLAIIGLIVLIRFINKAFNWLNLKINTFSAGLVFPDNKFFRIFSFITPHRQKQVLLILSRFFRLSLIVILLFFYLPFIFSFLPWTKGIADRFFDYIASPLKFIGLSIVRFLPDLIFIIIIAVVTHYVVKFLGYLASEIERENINIEGFYPDWALPTFRIVRFLIYIFALIIVFPYLPGSDSPAFKGISIFFGVLISLGSTSAISNVVAGVVITYMRPFQLGDRVKIGETVGDVVEKNLLVTRIMTIKNEDITIPNATILNNHLKNYTRHSENIGVILHTSVTIGYDVSWQKVRELLIAAALECEHLDKEPKPFVLQTSLDDFYISYELNAYTKKPQRMAMIYSELHRLILDKFNEAGVEIMSPHYRAIRDGNMIAVPVDHVPKDYIKQGFKIDDGKVSGGGEAK